ncbi:hypothetical protein C8N25_11122 [Algoriphagus antarcticus]|uniref:Uncharacterized protein n=1 Tax=Algoriphagus antarcticus TaxID=238540 RepID=A0A3E0DX03_9BACT|nr:hypothetical protein C8N25_11122 [Algoriphagus antarcticus]
MGSEKYKKKHFARPFSQKNDFILDIIQLELDELLLAF